MDSPFTSFQFPDGAAHIKGADSDQKFLYQIADIRGASHDDLFTLAMWSESCEQRGEKKVLILPYLPGARMDRGVPNGAAVYGSFINTAVTPDLLITLDPHSPAALHAFDRTQTTLVYPVERMIRHFIQDASTDSKAHTYVGVIAPDKGAHDRAAAAAKVMGVPVYQAGKTRDEATGKLSGFEMIDELPKDGKLLIVDDICDGGGTFLGLVGATGLPKDRVDLWVTHGIFSKGLGDLLAHFGMIHTTDSYFTTEGIYHPSGATGSHFVDHKRVRVHKIGALLEAEAINKMSDILEV